MDRAGLRRKLLKAQAEAGDIVLSLGTSPKPSPIPIWRTSGPRKGPTYAFQPRANGREWQCLGCWTGGNAT